MEGATRSCCGVRERDVEASSARERYRANWDSFAYAFQVPVMRGKARDIAEAERGRRRGGGGARGKEGRMERWCEKMVDDREAVGGWLPALSAILGSGLGFALLRLDIAPAALLIFCDFSSSFFS